MLDLMSCTSQIAWCSVKYDVVMKYHKLSDHFGLAGNNIAKNSILSGVISQFWLERDCKIEREREWGRERERERERERKRESVGL